MDEELRAGRLSRIFPKLVIPAVISQFVTLLYNIVDRIYIGHIPEIGSMALTGVGICMPAVMVMNSFAQLVGMGGAPRMSFSWDRGRRRRRSVCWGVVRCSLGFLGSCSRGSSGFFLIL